MKKSQAVLLHLLILAILGGFTGIYFSIQQDKSSNDFHFQKNRPCESISIFFAEEEVNNEASNARKAHTLFIFNFEVWEPTRVSAPKELYSNKVTSIKEEKIFLLHLQLLI